MRNLGLFLAFLTLIAGPAFAQQELALPAENGPLSANAASPAPDKDGVYRTGPGIVAPVLVRAVPASDNPKACTPSLAVVSAVIGIDGVARVREVYQPHNTSCETLATAAVEQSRFQPGALSGKPVPVLVCVGVPFLLQIMSPIPEVRPCPAGFGAASAPEPDAANPPACPAQFSRGAEAVASPEKPRSDVKPPRLINPVEAEFPDELRREMKKKHIRNFEAISLLALIVDRDGYPQNVCLVKSAGYGLDAEAAKAVKRYRFDPATKDGEAVPVVINIEVDFKLY